MNKFKKILSAGVATLLACVTIGCTTGSGTGNGGNGGNGGDVEIVDGKRVLNFSFLKAGFGMTPYEELAKAYMEKNPDVLIKLDADPYINTNVDLQINNGTNVADLYCVRDIDKLRQFVGEGKIMDISALLGSSFEEGYKEAGTTVKSNLSSQAIEAGTLFGKQWFVPEYTSINGFVYNSSLFEENGWTVPTTTKELEDLCKQIISETDGEVAPITYCGSAADGYLYFAVDNWMCTYSGLDNLDEFYEFGSPEVFAVNSPVTQAKIQAHNNLLKFFKDISEGGYALDGSMEIDHHTAQGHIIDGNAAMMLNGAWFENEMATVMRDEKYADLELGMFPLPYISDENNNKLFAEGYNTEDGKQIINADFGAYYFIPTDATNVDDAKDFLKFINSDEASELYTKYSNAPRPVNYNLDPEDEYYKDISAFGKSILKMAHDCYLYAPISSSILGINGVVGCYPQGDYYTKKMLLNPAQYGVEKIMESDYDYVSENWEQWVSEWLE
ncbi:MAG: extracellular solute-binding protein [Clostridiales bacterium]|nr:extracellular solute-binding protein [Clostridiales bacterium]